MSQTIELASAGQVVLDLVDIINQNRAYLSEIDGAIGDGDHGINMSKGFSQCRDCLFEASELPGLAKGLDTLATTLLEGIGGSLQSSKGIMRCRQPPWVAQFLSRLLVTIRKSHSGVFSCPRTCLNN